MENVIKLEKTDSDINLLRYNYAFIDFNLEINGVANDLLVEGYTERDENFDYDLEYLEDYDGHGSTQCTDVTLNIQIKYFNADGEEVPDEKVLIEEDIQNQIKKQVEKEVKEYVENYINNNLDKFLPEPDYD